MAARTSACAGVREAARPERPGARRHSTSRELRRRHRPQLSGLGVHPGSHRGGGLREETLIFAATSGGVGGSVGFGAAASPRGEREGEGGARRTAFRINRRSGPGPRPCDGAHGSGTRSGAVALSCAPEEGERHGPPVEGLRHVPDGGVQAGARDAHRGVPARLLRGQPRLRLEHAPRSCSRSSARCSRRRSPSSTRPRASRSSGSGPRSLVVSTGSGPAARSAASKASAPRRWKASTARSTLRRASSTKTRLRVARRLALLRREAHVGPVGLQLAGAHVVLPHRVERLDDLLREGGLDDGERDLDAAEEVPLHPVGRREPDLRARRRSRRRTRGCARGSGPRCDRTRIVSETPGTPGRRQQMPRTRRSIGTPACDAS